MQDATESDFNSDLRIHEQMGRIGVELLAKAALCAMTIALLAGIMAALLGS